MVTIHKYIAYVSKDYKNRRVCMCQRIIKIGRPTCRLKIVLSRPICWLKIVLSRPTCRLKIVLSRPTCRLKIVLSRPTCRLKIVLSRPTCRLKIVLSRPTCRLKIILSRPTCRLKTNMCTLKKNSSLISLVKPIDMQEFNYFLVLYNWLYLIYMQLSCTNANTIIKTI